MPSWNEEDIQYLKARGHAPDDISTFLRRPQDFSPDGYASLLIGLNREDITPSDEPALRTLLTHRNGDVCGPALRLLVDLRGNNAAPICRDCLASPTFANKPAAMQGLIKTGAPSDAKPLLSYAKKHLTGRARKWAGETPIVAAFRFLESHPECATRRAELADWTAKRWPLLSADEQRSLAAHAPALDQDPPLVVLIASSAELLERAADIARAARPSVQWKTAPARQQSQEHPPGSSVLALDQPSYAAALRSPGRHPIARPRPYPAQLTSDRKKRTLQRCLAAFLDDLYPHATTTNAHPDRTP